MSDRVDEQHQNLEKIEIASDKTRDTPRSKEAFEKIELPSETVTLGHSKELAPYWHEQNHPLYKTYDCGVVAQTNLMEAMGKKVSDEDVRQLGEKMTPPAYARNDPYGRNGTFQTGYALDSYGVGRIASSGSEAPEHLTNALTDNRGVIARVDTGVLWDGKEANGQLHAVWVTGAEVDKRSGQITKVYANDSGRSDGKMIEYDGKTFMEAWRATDYKMVETTAHFPLRQ